MKINYLAVSAAAIAWFVVGSLWYSPLLFGKQWLALNGMGPGSASSVKVTAWKALGELAQGFVVAYVLARLLALPGFVDWRSAMQLGLWVSVGFPFIVLVTSMIGRTCPGGWRPSM